VKSNGGKIGRRQSRSPKRWCGCRSISEPWPVLAG